MRRSDNHAKQILLSSMMLDLLREMVQGTSKNYTCHASSEATPATASAGNSSSFGGNTCCRTNSVKGSCIMGLLLWQLQ